MAKGFNKVTLMGNLTRDPETRQTPSGQSVTNFSLAVNRTWKGQDGSQQEAVSYIDCVCWGKAGEIIAQYMQKGRPILVSGRHEHRSAAAPTGGVGAQVQSGDGGEGTFGEPGRLGEAGRAR